MLAAYEKNGEGRTVHRKDPSTVWTVWSSNHPRAPAMLFRSSRGYQTPAIFFLSGPGIQVEEVVQRVLAYDTQARL